MGNTNMKRIHLVYARQYQDPEDGSDFFYSYNTIFRNVPIKHINTLEKFKDKIKKYCDKNYVESATNFIGNTKVAIIEDKEYYTTYEDVFGTETVGSGNALFNDYGQLYNGRQFHKKDYDPKFTDKFTFKNLNKIAS